MTLELGITLALLCALTTNLGFLLKHRGACAAPDVDWRHPVASAVGLFRSKWFAVGMLVAVGAWLLHVGAMALAPLSFVQAVISGGLVFLAVLAERLFGFKLGLRQWLGVGFTALGLMLLAFTLPGSADGHSSYSVAGMVAF
jgi:drug/metabolite transporter (DMT)-like permease